MRKTTSARLKRFVIVLTVLTLAIFGAVVALALTNPVLSVSGKTDTTVSLSWTDGGDETKYLVKQKVGTQFNTIATLPANTLTYTVAGLTPNTTYQFYVAAAKDKGAAYNSNTVTVTTLGAPPPTTTTTPPPPTNAAPVVSAGPDQTITLPAGATLDGTVTDDGLPNPPATVTTTWSRVSGPGTATFGNAGAVDTTATFSVDGIYILRLTASDSVLSTSDDMTMTVNPEPPPSCTGVQVAPGNGLKAAVDAEPPGTTFCLSAGTYTVNANVDLDSGDVIDGAGNTVTFVDGSGLPLIDGNPEAADIFSARGDVIIRDVAMFGAPTPTLPSSFTGASYGLAVRNMGSPLTLLNVSCHDNGGACSGQAGSIVADNIDCYNNGSAFSMQPAIRYAACIKVVAAYDSTSGDATVTNSNIHDNTWSGLWFDFDQAGHVVITDNLITDNGVRGIHWEMSGGFTTTTNGFHPTDNNALIARNTITGNGWRVHSSSIPICNGDLRCRAGVHVSTANDIIVEDNIFGNQSTFAISVIESPSRRLSNQPSAMSGVVFRNNTMNGDAISGCGLSGVTCSGNV